MNIKNVLNEFQNYNYKDEYNNYVDKLPKIRRDRNMSDDEYREFLKNPNVLNHYDLDKAARKHIQQGSDDLTVNDQLAIAEELKRLLRTRNLPVLEDLGTILTQYIQYCVKRNKIFDKDLYTEINDSNVLSKALKADLETQQKAILTKNRSGDIDLLLQKSLYDALYRERNFIIGAKMIFGIICKKYLENANMRLTLIDNYLLFKIGELVYSGIHDDPYEDE
jgi:hypothetical protein